MKRRTTGSVVEKPQNAFVVKVDNRPLPFKPLLRHKPNGKTPLNLRLITDNRGTRFYEHPYLVELEEFRVPDEHLRVAEDERRPPALTDTRFTEVRTAEQLREMMAELRGVRELAVDLEAHSYRSYQGLTCLMQLSTRAADYLVDTLALRDGMLELNEVFTDPAVVKVFHGADNDVLWLQRDLGLYVVNMFDTYQAAQILNLARKGLDFLLQRYCGVTTDKSFQLYDWRTRPLSAEAMHYARCDTHYLLYVYDAIRRDLASVHSDYVELTFDRSTDVCKLRYEVNVLRDDSYLKVFRRSYTTRDQFDDRQMETLKELFAWRDALARRLDESTGYVMPNQMLLRISETMPRDPPGVLACCSPNVPRLVRQRVHEIIRVIRRVRNLYFENGGNGYGNGNYFAHSYNNNSNNYLRRNMR